MAKFLRYAPFAKEISSQNLVKYTGLVYTHWPYTNNQSRTQVANNSQPNFLNSIGRDSNSPITGGQMDGGLKDHKRVELTTKAKFFSTSHSFTAAYWENNCRRAAASTRSDIFPTNNFTIFFLAVSSKRGTAIVMPLSRKSPGHDLVPLTSTDFDEWWLDG